jgi:hypothetical protein
VIPLLQLQRLGGRQQALVPPDFLLLLPGGQAFGVEMGDGQGRFSLQPNKLRQSNAFSGCTGIPVVTGTIPNMYRCEACKRWIAYCDRAIKKAATGRCASMPEFLHCRDCKAYNSGQCPLITYYGMLEPKGKARRYHYRCVREEPYVENLAKRERERAQPGGRQMKLIHYVPQLAGLEDLVRKSGVR